MRKVCFALLVFLSGNLFAQNNFLINIEKEIFKQPGIDKKDSVFFSIFMKYAWYKPDSALYYSKKEVLLAKELNSPLMECRALSRYGYILGMIGNYPQGIDYLLQAEKMIWAVEKDPWFLSVNYVFLTEIYTDEGDFKQATYYANKIKKINALNLNDENEQWYVRMARIYERSGRLDSALIFGRKAYQAEIKINGKAIWTTIPLTLADCYAGNKMYDSALRYYNMTLPLAFEKSLGKEIILSYNGIAKVYQNTGQKDSSLYYAYKALDYRFDNPYPLGTLATYHILYGLYREQRKTDSAIQYLEKTITLKDSLFNQQKEREVQTLAFNEQLKQQEVMTKQTQYRNKLRLYSVLGITCAIMIVALLLWRNIRHRQKAYVLLQKQKAETDQQRVKVEQTLDQLKSTQSQLIQSEKMASLGELTAGIAHEIQNPLNFVNNFSEVNKELLAEIKDEIDKGNLDEVKALANDVIDNEEKINHHGKRADAIVKGMLQHSRSSSGVKEPTDINALVDEYLRLAYHGLRAKDNFFNATMKTDFDESIGNINIIQQDIGRVILNLITNAFYAVTEKKKQQPDGYEPTVSVSTRKMNGKVEIKVADNGNGIPQKILDKIFQPFFTTKPTGQGTGLGLSLSYDIVKAHGGEIKVETKEGEGSEFIIQMLVI